jgi:hypothetical protein
MIFPVFANGRNIPVDTLTCYARAVAASGRIQCVGALATLDLDVLGDDFEILGGGEPGERLALRLEPYPALSIIDRLAADISQPGFVGRVKPLPQAAGYAP